VNRHMKIDIRAANREGGKQTTKKAKGESVRVTKREKPRQSLTKLEAEDSEGGRLATEDSQKGKESRLVAR